MPVIPATREAEAGEPLELKVEVAVSPDCAPAGQPEQQSETVSQTQTIRWVWWYMPAAPAAWEAEVRGSPFGEGQGCGESRPHHCTLAWATEPDLVFKNKTTTKNPKQKAKRFRNHCL